MENLKHKHHIIPRHAGGSDDPSNLIELAVEEHAEAHRKLYEEHGRWQDKIAWEMLSGQIGNEQAIQEARGAANRGRKRSPETIEKIRQAAIARNKRLKDSGELDKINAKRSASAKGKKKPEGYWESWAEGRKGHEVSEETRNKISNSLKGNTNRKHK